MKCLSCYGISMTDQSKNVDIINLNEETSTEVCGPSENVTELLGSIALVYCGKKRIQRKQLQSIGNLCPYALIDAVRHNGVDLTDPSMALLASQAQQTWLGCREGVLTGKEPVILLDLSEQ